MITAINNVARHPILGDRRNGVDNPEEIRNRAIRIGQLQSKLESLGDLMPESERAELYAFREARERHIGRVVGRGLLPAPPAPVG
jgi:hypothetical protein